ncbi:hypothetical protein M1E17_04100 [Arthrobacter sp. D1-29]
MAIRSAMASATSRVRRCHVPGLSQLRSSLGAAAGKEEGDEGEEGDKGEDEDKATA